MKFRALAAALALAAVTAGCGLKGPLYLPEKAGPVTTRPGPTATAPATAPAAEPPAAEPKGEPPAPPDGTSGKTGG